MACYGLDSVDWADKLQPNQPGPSCSKLTTNPPCDREVAGSIPGRVMPIFYKRVLALVSLVFSSNEVDRARNRNWLVQCQ